jgi:response regulator RpfG family c-di-GMP phosphodiesterase
VITVAGRNGGGIRFTEGEREVLHTMAEQAVIALLNVEFFERQEKMALKTMGAFDNLFETGDPEKEGHAQRLARMLDAFGVFLKIDVQTRQVCQMVAFIHNIALLKITQANRAFRKNVDDDLKHIEVGMRMARRLDLPEKTVSILRDHHEHFDGSGQPRGLKGDEIPLGARLLTLLDYYMSMVTPVPHGAGLRPVDALKLIQNYSGSFFDPNLVESFNKFMSLRSNEFGNEE